MKLSPIKPQSLVEQVSEKLGKIILSLKDGENRQLPSERRLSEQLGVSRQVVREAIQCLKLQGLLEVRQGVGIQVIDKLHTPLNSALSFLIPDKAERLRQLQETRLAIEPNAAGLAALRANKEQVGNLCDIHMKLEEATNNCEAIEIDLQFHRAVAISSGNLMFRLILDSLAEISLESRLRTIGRIGKQSAIEEHAIIIQAIEDGDAAEAADAMRHHLYAAGKDMKLSELKSKGKRKNK